MAFNFGSNAAYNIVGSLPSYDPTHDYTFILNTGLTDPGQLHFGVSDGGYNDNTGAYSINVQQLTAVSEPSEYAAFALGALAIGCLMLRTRKNARSS